jgi:FHS family L-fucose permease-like MFS transporter
MLFIPAGNAMAFWAFLVAYFVMTCGLSFLETTSNPYIIALGPEETGTRRLNLAQAFNPIGSLTGMLVAKEIILSQLSRATEQERLAMRDSAPDALAAIQQNDLNIVSGPYLTLGVVVLAVFVAFALLRLPRGVSEAPTTVAAPCRAGGGVLASFRRLLHNRRYVRSVGAQTCYIGAQIMVWTFIIQYAEKELGMSKATAQGYNMVAMSIFVASRFVCTFLLKYFRSSTLLTVLAVGGSLLTLGVIFLHGMAGLYCLIAISACMSLMFPTIYGIALKGLGDDTKLASAGLILAIGGGCLLPPLQGMLIDKAVWFGEAFSSVRVSFVLSLLCFLAVAAFGRWVGKQSKAELTC